MSVSSQIDEADEIIESTSVNSTTDRNQTPTSTPNIPQPNPNMEHPKKEPGEAKPQPTMLREMNFWTPTSY